MTNKKRLSEPVTEWIKNRINEYEHTNLKPKTKDKCRLCAAPECRTHDSSLAIRVSRVCSNLLIPKEEKSEETPNDCLFTPCRAVHVNKRLKNG